jgi:hypothetical protein
MNREMEMAKRTLFTRITIGGLEWVGRLVILWLFWPFKYFTFKRVIFAVIFFAAGVGAVGVGLMGIAHKRCVVVEGGEACFLIFPIEATVANAIK